MIEINFQIVIYHYHIYKNNKLIGKIDTASDNDIEALSEFFQRLDSEQKNNILKDNNAIFQAKKVKT
jgi:hypothetical protein